MTTTDERLLKQLHSSLCVRWGTSAPYAIGRVRAQRIGFASIPMVVVDVWCRSRDYEALIPIVRQRVYTELAERGWTPDDLKFVPTVGGSWERERLFTDGNEESESHGKRKRGVHLEFHWEMERDLARATFDPRVRPGQAGSFATLPERSATDDS